MSGHRSKRQGSPKMVSVSSRGFSGPTRSTSGGMSCKKYVSIVEFCRIAGARRGLFSRFDRPCCAPPCTGGLAGLRDHRVYEHDHPNGFTRAHKGHREAGQRLGDKNYVASLGKRADNDVRIRCETGSAVVTRQVDCDGFVPRGANKRDNAMPVPSHAACPRDKDECCHMSSPPLPPDYCSTGLGLLDRIDLAMKFLRAAGPVAGSTCSYFMSPVSSVLSLTSRH